MGSVPARRPMCEKSKKFGVCVRCTLCDFVLCVQRAHCVVCVTQQQQQQQQQQDTHTPTPTHTHNKKAFVLTHSRIRKPGSVAHEFRSQVAQCHVVRVERPAPVGSPQERHHINLVVSIMFGPSSVGDRRGSEHAKKQPPFSLHESPIEVVVERAPSQPEY